MDPMASDHTLQSPPQADVFFPGLWGVRNWPYVSVSFPPVYSCDPRLASGGMNCQNQTKPNKCTTYFHGTNGTKWQVMAHEWGHNLGLGHSGMRNNGVFNEVCNQCLSAHTTNDQQQYGDPTSSMGNNLLGTCYSAPQLHALQWIKVCHRQATLWINAQLPQPQEVTQDKLPPGKVVNFFISASTRGGPLNGQPGQVALFVKNWINRAYINCMYLVHQATVIQAWITTSTCSCGKAPTKTCRNNITTRLRCTRGRGRHGRRGKSNQSFWGASKPAKTSTYQCVVAQVECVVHVICAEFEAGRAAIQGGKQQGPAADVPVHTCVGVLWSQ